MFHVEQRLSYIPKSEFVWHIWSWQLITKFVWNVSEGLTMLRDRHRPPLCVQFKKFVKKKSPEFCRAPILKPCLLPRQQECCKKHHNISLGFWQWLTDHTNIMLNVVYWSVFKMYDFSIVGLLPYSGDHTDKWSSS